MKRDNLTFSFPVLSFLFPFWSRIMTTSTACQCVQGNLHMIPPQDEEQQRENQFPAGVTSLVSNTKWPALDTSKCKQC